MAVATKPRLWELFRPKATEPEIVDVPAAQFLMIDGDGDPNNSKTFQESVNALYSLAYGLKFLLKKQGIEYRVSPLEGLWWAPDMTVFELERKTAYRWTLLTALPDEVSAESFEEVRRDARRRRPSQALERARLKRFHEGLAAQIMHIGPYATESATIARLHAFITDHGYTFDGVVQKHHEIYLRDPRRATPDKLKTIIRQPIKPRR